MLSGNSGGSTIDIWLLTERSRLFWPAVLIILICCAFCVWAKQYQLIKFKMLKQYNFIFFKFFDNFCFIKECNSFDFFKISLQRFTVRLANNCSLWEGYRASIFKGSRRSIKFFCFSEKFRYSPAFLAMYERLCENGAISSVFFMHSKQATFLKGDPGLYISHSLLRSLFQTGFSNTGWQ